MDKPSLRQRLRYRFDNFMSKGGSAMFICLIVVSFAALVIIGTTRGIVEMPSSVTSERGDGFFRQVYISFLQMTDPGNMAQDIESTPWLKLPAILAGLTGVVLLSMLIGFITTALATKMDELRKGHSRVVENDHTLILGWNEQRIVEITRELIMANESEDNPAVVVLADHPKEKMDDYLSLILPGTENTRLVTRSGSASSLTNLKISAVETARSVIVLASCSENGNEEEKTASDAKTIKTILAVATCRDKANELNIVAELFNPEHLEIVQESCPHPITVADSNEILAKLIVQTSRSVGLSIAYSEILSFDGCEMYFNNANWDGITFGEIQFHFPDGVPMGIRDEGGEIFLNPPIDRQLAPSDDILILAEDDSTIEFRKKPVTTAQNLPLKEGRLEQHQENELIIGWNRKASIIIENSSE